jgi:hypothetical protein
MKKFIVLCIGVAFATSCKKDYTCECTSTSTTNGKTSTTVDSYKAKTTKKDADAWCAAIPKSTVNVGGSPSSSSSNETCVLK